MFEPVALFHGAVGPWVAALTVLGVTAVPTFTLGVWPYGLVALLVTLVLLLGWAGIRLQGRHDERDSFPAQFRVGRHVAQSALVYLEVANRSEEQHMFSAKAMWRGFAYLQEAIQWHLWDGGERRPIDGFQHELLDLAELDQRTTDTLVWPILAAGGGRSHYHKGTEQGANDILRVLVRRADKSVWWEVEVGFRVEPDRVIEPYILSTGLHIPDRDE